MEIASRGDSWLPPHLDLNRLLSSLWISFNFFGHKFYHLLYRGFKWMSCDFTSFSTVFQSYQDDWRLIMKGCVQWNSVNGREDFASSRDQTRSARSVGQRLTHWPIRALNGLIKTSQMSKNSPWAYERLRWRLTSPLHFFLLCLGIV